jgi:two-component sensor histidine kinase
MELRLRESGHRIRNVFANMRALLKLCERTAQTPAELVSCVELRITSLVRSTERLLWTQDGSTSSHDIIIGELSPYLEAGTDRLLVSGDDVMLEAGHAVPFGMIIHELANNASKYGSLSNDTGRVEVRIGTRGDNELVLEWREVGGPQVEQPGQKGLGSQLIEGLLRIQFTGHWNPEYPPDGFRGVAVLQLPQQAEASSG